MAKVEQFLQPKEFKLEDITKSNKQVKCGDNVLTLGGETQYINLNNNYFGWSQPEGVQWSSVPAWDNRSWIVYFQTLNTDGLGTVTTTAVSQTFSSFQSLIDELNNQLQNYGSSFRLIGQSTGNRILIADLNFVPLIDGDPYFTTFGFNNMVLLIEDSFTNSDWLVKANEPKPFNLNTIFEYGSITNTFKDYCICKQLKSIEDGTYQEGSKVVFASSPITVNGSFLGWSEPENVGWNNSSFDNRVWAVSIVNVSTNGLPSTSSGVIGTASYTSFQSLLDVINTWMLNRGNLFKLIAVNNDRILLADINGNLLNTFSPYLTANNYVDLTIEIVDNVTNSDWIVKGTNVDLLTLSNVTYQGGDCYLAELPASDGNDNHIVRTNALVNIAPTALEISTPTNGDTAKVFLNNNSIEYWSYNSSTWTKDTTSAGVLPVFRFGSVAPAYVAATDTINSTYVRTTNGLIPNITGSNIVDEWVLDGTNTWRIVSKAQDAVVSVTGATLPITFPITTIPGTPVFTPNQPTDTTVVYQFTDGTLASWNGTQYIGAASSNDWRTLGNAGTVQTTNFIGTTDNIGLSLRTNNAIRQTITNVGNVGINTIAPISTLDVFGTTVSGGSTNAKTALVNTTGGIGTYSLGNVLATTAIQAPISVARFGLEGTSAVKQSPAMDIKIGTHTAGINGNTRADFVLTNGNSVVPDITAMTILSTGATGFRTNNPLSTVDAVSADNAVATEIVRAMAQNLTQGTALTYSGLFSTGANANVAMNIGAKGTSVTAIGVTPAGAVQGNVGIATTNAINTLQIGTPAVANTAGVRLPITSATAPQIISNKFLTVNPSGDVVLASRADHILSTQTTAYTLTANDANTIVSINSATPVNVTLSGLVTGNSVKIYQQGAGQITFVTGTLTRRHVFNLFSSAGQFSIVEITVIGTDAVLSGQLA
jgi:hypothetical protein